HLCAAGEGGSTATIKESQVVFSHFCKKTSRQPFFLRKQAASADKKCAFCVIFPASNGFNSY
ncbi:hypothetical protein, partial [Shimia thalassica]|uniref:hypothetical protein n=1 Tax=Shimia thalassica TaxID=1715693 RepID=UPI001F28F498